MIINAFCADLGWLFSDLLRHFDQHDEVLATDVPTHADAWICIRSWEAGVIPDPQKAIVQIHALDPHLILGNNCEPAAIDAAAGLVFTHPEQPKILEGLGISLADKRCLMRPIGALDIFTVRQQLSPEPTFAWVGRDTGRNKRIDLFCEAMERVAASTDINAVLLGEHLNAAFTRLAVGHVGTIFRERASTPIEDYPEVYQRCDAVVITSMQEAGPMCLFEALASGVPVIATRCGWAEYLIQEGVNGYLIDESKHMATDIVSRMLDIASHRREWFAKRELIRASLMGWSLEGWIEDNVALAVEVASGE